MDYHRQIAGMRRPWPWKEGAYTALCGGQYNPLDKPGTNEAEQYKIGFIVGESLRRVAEHEHIEIEVLQ